MLGHRTKPIVAYGKKGGRKIVNISERYDRENSVFLETDLISSDYLAKATEIAPNRSDQGKRVKEGISVALSPENLNNYRFRAKHKKLRDISNTPRKPLSASQNSKHDTPNAHKPSKSSVGKKPFSPFVDLEIITIDDAGRQISDERRRICNNLQFNTVSPIKRSQGHKSKGMLAQLRPSNSDIRLLEFQKGILDVLAFP